jgi:hypothetical protein
MLLRVNRTYAVAEQVKVMDKDSDYINKTGIVVASRVKDGEAQYLVWYINGEDKQAIFTAKQLRHLHRPFSKTLEIAVKCTTAGDFEEKDNTENPEEDVTPDENPDDTIIDGDDAVDDNL